MNAIAAFACNMFMFELSYCFKMTNYELIILKYKWSCRKRKGHKPTGKLVRAAKAEGYSSVSQMLAVKGEEILESVSASNEVATTTSEKVC